MGVLAIRAKSIARCVFGSYDMGREPVLELGGYRLEVSARGDRYYYERRGPGGSYSFVTPAGGGRRLGVYPAPPVLALAGQIKHVMLRFPESIVLLPGESVSLYAVSPADVAVFVEAGRESKLIDWFSPLKVKLAVYGSLSEGLLCRSYTTRVLDEAESDTVFGEAVFRLTVENSTKRSASLSRLVLPAEQMTLYYKGEKAFLEDVHVTIETGLEASLRLLNKPPVSAEKALAIFRKEAREKWVMSYGY